MRFLFVCLYSLDRAILCSLGWPQMYSSQPPEPWNSTQASPCLVLVFEAANRHLGRWKAKGVGWGSLLRPHPNCTGSKQLKNRAVFNFSFFSRSTLFLMCKALQSSQCLQVRWAQGQPLTRHRAAALISKSPPAGLDLRFKL